MTNLNRKELVKKAVEATKAYAKNLNIVGGGRISAKDFEKDTNEELLATIDGMTKYNAACK